jgi:hypothetical protein
MEVSCKDDRRMRRNECSEFFDGVCEPSSGRMLPELTPVAMAPVRCKGVYRPTGVGDLDVVVVAVETRLENQFDPTHRL